MSSKLNYIRGDLFSAPRNAILVHACNTRGSWGAGIALAFKDQYPDQYETYRAHCKEHGQSLVGTCLLLPGTDDTHSIACLFTSRAYGKRKDTPLEILSATRLAVQDLLVQNKDREPLHACRFNSGKFAVPWADTEAVLQELKVEMTIYTPE
ncbi:hypothetical protein D9619_000711 [Psilocybe cf. subviscida]|uniref:ADP-ribose 1''-phosphate phosphatase n=1 Tax=Psilocybe cf. subviscida TaxID=2480587 RepID=A0A8H5F2Y5_9AGAR|nr:hypothetical protein D9619_000711 [Psilocybe cf. subviscida]